VLRDRAGLERLQQTLGQAPCATGALDLATVEATSLHAVSVLVTTAALARTESRGCHRWRGTRPVISAERASHTLLSVTGGQPGAVAAAGARSRA
jgi:L-aspartate oxidase